MKDLARDISVLRDGRDRTLRAVLMQPAFLSAKQLNEISISSSTSERRHALPTTFDLVISELPRIPTS